MALRQWMRLILVGFCFVLNFSCTEQHDPRRVWKMIRSERDLANRPNARLSADGKIPLAAGATAEVAGNPIDKKYANFCASCHGAEGKGDGAGGVALNPKPRNFVDWKDPAVTDDYIAKVIREGGAAVGKSPNMAPWGGVLSADELTEMVKKVRSFRK